MLDDEALALGTRIRERRRALGLSLVRLAAMTDLSHPFLSQVERGHARPSVTSLQRIAAALGVDAGWLFTVDDDDREVVQVVAGDAVRPLRVANGEAEGSVRTVTAAGWGAAVDDIVDLPDRFGEPATSDGDLLCYVLDGAAEVQAAGDVHQLGAHDAIFISAAVAYGLRSAGGPARVLLIRVPGAGAARRRGAVGPRRGQPASAARALTMSAAGADRSRPARFRDTVTRTDRTFDPPAAAVRDAVARAYAEDLGPLGDLTAALVPPDAEVTARIVARAPGVLAGSACVDEAFAQLDVGVVVDWSLGRRCSPLRRLERRGRLRPAGLRADRRAHGAELPVPPLRRGHADPAVRRCRLGRQPRRADLGHPQDPARTAGPREGCRPGWRRRQPPRLAVGLRARQGQPPRRPLDHRRGAAGGGALAGPNGGGGVRPARAGRGGDRRRRRPRDARQHDAGARSSAAWRSWPAGRSWRSRAASASTPIAAYAAAGADLISTSAITQSAPALDVGLDWERRVA